MFNINHLTCTRVVHASYAPQEWKESLPNIEFWSEIPGLVKDGCGFFVAKVKGLLGQGDGTYVPIGSSASSVRQSRPVFIP
jgi:hypothetical protein